MHSPWIKQHRRAKLSIAKRGFAVWHDDYLKRRPPIQQQEEGPSRMAGIIGFRARAESEPNAGASAIPRPPPGSASYDEHLNYFLTIWTPPLSQVTSPSPVKRARCANSENGLNKL
ncbi:hypothetical protein C8F04DRAFT_1278405 [Mycena alexandri]|uniref:Uncharacterized protein n=1 Tax=Mycena alexandri TaxID=1745969 RepID=A0AAD6RZ50_9AGAR|nr:hypothetical protein C8F04DRAFT_1278405 [Mycena alexandri]